MPPKKFPKMTVPPVHVRALSWYQPGTPGLEKMGFQARGKEVSLLYQHPDPFANLVGVPRTLAPIPPEVDERAVGAFSFEAAFTSDLRPEQVPFVEQVFSTLETEHGCIGEAPTGFGKTVAGCWLAAHIGRPICVVIPKGDLDWKPALLKHTTIPEGRIDTWSGQKLPDPNAWVVVAMLQSIYRDGVYPPEIYDRFACVIFDEVHRLGTEEFGKAIRKFSAMFRLGLSATPDRRDGKMDLIHAHVGWTHVVGHTDAEQPNYYVIDTGWTEPIGRDGKPMRYDPARTDTAKRHLMADAYRNAKIVSAALRASTAGRRTIVFVEQTKHQNRLYGALRDAGVPSRLIARYGGDATADEKARAKACAAGTIMLATYKYTAEGTDIPALDTAIIAHPIYDPRQAVGRITRKHPGKPTPVVIDLVDTGSDTLTRIHRARWEYLRNLGATWKGLWS